MDSIGIAVLFLVIWFAFSPDTLGTNLGYFVKAFNEITRTIKKD